MNLADNDIHNELFSHRNQIYGWILEPIVYVNKHFF